MPECIVQLKGFGERLTRRMDELGIDAKMLALDIYVSKQSVYKYMWGKSYPNIDKLIDISNILDCSIDYLLKGE